MQISKMSRPVFSWAMYDFANSAYTTSIQSVIFSVYFVRQFISPGGVQIFSLLMHGESMWSFLNSAVMFGVILLSPALGTLADHRSSKQSFLRGWALVACLGA